MNILYIANSRMPTEKAHGWQIMKSCEAFSRLGCEVELVVPKRFNPIKENAFNYYQIEKIFKIKYLPCLDLVQLGRIGFLIQLISFSFIAFLYAITRRVNIFYTRDENTAFWLCFFKKNIFYEMHDYPLSRLWMHRILFKRVKKIISTNTPKKDLLIEDFKVSKEKIFIQPNGIDLEQFKITADKNYLRNKTNLPLDKKIISYIGKFKTKGESKGVEDIIYAFKKLNKKQPKSFLLFVGINKEEVAEVEKIFTNHNINQDSYRIITHVPQAKIVYFLKASDVLIINYPNTRHYAYFCSPIKMFEYMASGVPIVSTDLPSIREALNEDNSMLVEPGKIDSLVNGIQKVIENKDLADKISRQALLDIKKYSWRIRGENILKMIKSSI